MYIRLSFLSKKNIDNKKKKAYIDKFFPEDIIVQTKGKERNQGFLRKFNNAVGFKDVVGYYDNYDCYIRPKVSSPKEYISPDRLLKDSLGIDFDGKYIATFTVEDKYIEHPSKKYSYKTRDIISKLEGFANKVFPELEFFIEELDELPEKTEKEFVLENFILGISNRMRYTVEVSLGEKLDSEEVKEILDILKTICDFDIGIRQEYCETCFENSNGKAPYHVEVDYLD